MARAGPLWKVVGGEEKGGIVVREEQETSSSQFSDFLHTGAVVEQIELAGSRLHYKLVRGGGPREGWVTVKVKNKDLLVLETPAPASGASQGGSDVPELIYFNGFGRAELTRLAFHAGNVQFKDTRIESDDWPAVKEDPSSLPGQCWKTIPVIAHADLILAQSAATAQYAADLGMNVARPPTPKHRSLDTMMLGVRSDLHIEMYKGVFGSEKMVAAAKRSMGTVVKPLLEGIERRYGASAGPFLYAPESAGPTLGDLALFDLVTSPLPGLVALEVDLSPYPKIRECVSACQRSEALPGLRAYLDTRGF